MKRFIILFILVLISLPILKAQHSKPVYFEKAPNDMKRFYFDQNYYLVDKDCEFKYIERVSNFNTRTNKFEGEFRDFDLNGRVILSGQYQHGKKSGSFKAYHPNGVLKWEATFLDDAPTGPWQYFYPDGKPMLFITLNNTDFKLNQYWDRFGKQLVKDGEGTYDINLPLIGFTEHGYKMFNRQGKIKNGKPDGTWSISFIEGKRGNKTPLMLEQYENGVFQGKRYEADFEEVLIAEEDFVLVPNEYFPRAEQLLSKACSFDEFTGFNIYIANKFKQFLNQLSFQTKEDISIDLSYAVSVSKKGVPAYAVLIDPSALRSKEEKTLYTQMINQISYYLPSYLDNEPIADKLIVKFTLQTSGNNILVTPVKILREKGI